MRENENFNIFEGKMKRRKKVNQNLTKVINPHQTDGRIREKEAKSR